MSAKASLAGLQVLVLEDDSDSAFLTQMIELQQAQVFIANQVTQAIEALTQFEPDLIISDIMMPGLDGNYFIQMLRAQGIRFLLLQLVQQCFPKSNKQHWQQDTIASLKNRLT